MVKNIEIVVSNNPEFPRLIMCHAVVLFICTCEIKSIDFLLLESQ